MRILRRFVVLAVLIFWQGGFVFYASVVVPVGQEIFGHRQQGFVTRQVTNYLNLAGGIALLPLAWDVLAADPSAWRRRGRGLLWLIMLATLIALVWLHGRLDALLDPEDRSILRHAVFRPGHRLYLWLSTIQWAASILYLPLMLRAWQTEDQGRERTVRPPG